VTDPERLPTMAKKVADTPAAAEPPVAPAPPPTPSRPPPETVRDALKAMDAAWVAFRDTAARFPGERMDEHLSEDGWTRKQMLAHIAAWHDLTTERLGKFALGDKPVPLDGDENTINARVARQAIGKTAGEVLKDMEATFNKLRRRLQGMSDQQLTAHRGWAATIVADNTHEHYAEHMADIYSPAQDEAQKRRR
jgi:hypothetical protein